MPTPDYAKLAKTHIWYACYGSNLTWDRFKYYVQGGLCPFNGREYPGCADKTAPVESRAVHVPFDLYFGGSAQIWEGGGVGFLDASRPGDALARAWLITREQYEQVLDQEGRAPEWYSHEIDLDPIDGIDARTFTNASRRPKNAPTKPYLDVIRTGLLETFPQMPRAEIDAYLDLACSR